MLKTNLGLSILYYYDIAEKSLLLHLFRHLILEFASALVEGAKDDLIETIYNLTMNSFQVFWKGGLCLSLVYYIFNSLDQLIGFELLLECMVFRQIMRAFIMRHTALQENFWRCVFAQDYYVSYPLLVPVSLLLLNDAGRYIVWFFSIYETN